MSDSRKLALFIAITLSLFLLGGSYVLGSIDDSVAQPPAPPATVDLPLSDAVIFLDDHGTLSSVPTGQLEAAPTRTSLVCDRAYFSGGRGVCVAHDATGMAYRAVLFDSSMRVTAERPLAGVPSRARLSSDGKYVSVTNFVLGDSYADGTFSTRTSILDAVSGTEILHLEDLRTIHQGKVVDVPDQNYWGVTFQKDSDRFYATLGFGGKRYLIEGSISQRTARTIHEGVECPSLSPDGTRIAFKKQIERGTWNPYVLDLATMSETATSEHSSFDDQIEWLDNNTLLYGMAPSAIYAVPADGSGAPRSVVQPGSSPAVLR